MGLLWCGHLGDPDNLQGCGQSPLPTSSEQPSWKVHPRNQSWGTSLTQARLTHCHPGVLIIRGECTLKKRIRITESFDI